jgi:YrbI family 3-deoxy-D-manno-octulosonate 8-phosphate phosphatase
VYLEQNIKGLCAKFGVNYDAFLEDLGIETVDDMTVSDLEIVCEEYDTDLNALLFKHLFKSDILISKLKAIKLLVLDVDGVLTDGGMYFTESGDQFKKFNTKDGMAILHLTKNKFPVAIISSGFKADMVQRRAEMLGIQYCFVNRIPKIETLNSLCDELNLTLDNVAFIGDDINDLEVIKNVGFTACPRDAVNAIKSNVDVVLNKKGGDGCVRELIDFYILDEPL